MALYLFNIARDKAETSVLLYQCADVKCDKMDCHQGMLHREEPKPYALRRARM